METNSFIALLVNKLAEDETVKKYCWMPLGREYSYASISSMLLDAIFSVSVRYGQVQKLVPHHAKLNKFELCKEVANDPYPLKTLIEEAERSGGYAGFAVRLNNKCRTSSRGGILKAEAVAKAARVLLSNGINTIEQWRGATVDKIARIKTQFLKIKGQTEDVSWSYFNMLAGDSQGIKVDGRIIEYVEEAVGGHVDPLRASQLMKEACVRLQGNFGYPKDLNPRHLDYAVWSVVRARGQMP